MTGVGVGQLLTASEVAERLHIARSTFYTLPYFKRRRVVIGRAVRYRLSDVIAFEHEHTRAA